MMCHEVEILEHVGTDGMSPFFGSYIDNMDDYEFSEWVYYLLKSCNNKDILGMSNHGLLLVKKL